MKKYWETGVHVVIKGHDIYENLWMPVVPRKGDVLWLSSLTRGAVKGLEGTVSRVEWAMEQMTGNIYAIVTVRLILQKVKD
jgi:hypothetical protein